MNPKYLEEHAFFIFWQLMERLNVGISFGNDIVFDMDLEEDDL